LVNLKNRKKDAIAAGNSEEAARVGALLGRMKAEQTKREKEES
jgi:hypothetical protein